MGQVWQRGLEKPRMMYYQFSKYDRSALKCLKYNLILFFYLLNRLLVSPVYFTFALHLFIDPVIYSAIKVERCMFSTKGSIDLGYYSNNHENTKQVVLDG